MAKLLVPKAILCAGLIAGTLDITAACIDVAVNYKMGPFTLLQAVAGALLGPAAFEGGVPTAALGLLMHFTVAFTVTTIFYLLGKKFPVLLRWPWVSGLLFGAGVFLVMYRVTYPLTIALKTLYVTRPFNHNWPALRWSQFFVHLGCIGLPIAFITRRFLAPSPAAKRP